MKIDDLTWQYTGDSNWNFGTMLQGLVRDLKAQVYFSDELTGADEYGWVWIAFLGGGEVKRGVEITLQCACAACEVALLEVS